MAILNGIVLKLKYTVRQILTQGWFRRDSKLANTLVSKLMMIQ